MKVALSTTLAMMVTFGWGESVWADNVTLRVENDDTSDLYVTIIDMNTADQSAIWHDHPLRTGKPEKILAAADGDGHAHVTWTSKRTDVSKCGHGEKDGLGNEDRLDIDTSGDCPTSTKKQQKKPTN